MIIWMMIFKRQMIIPMCDLKTHQVLGDTCFEDSCKMRHDIIHSEIFLGGEPIQSSHCQATCSSRVAMVLSQWMRLAALTGCAWGGF